MAKERILSVLRPLMFFDDQQSHLQSAKGNIPMVHIPFGMANGNATPGPGAHSP